MLIKFVLCALRSAGVFGLYFGGGGGGGGDGGAAQMEKERQARIKAATDEINGIFNNQVKKTTTSTVMVPQTTTDAEGNPITTMVPQQQTADTWVDGDPANSRDKMYADQRSAVYDLNSHDVNRQADVAERTNRFGLARNGLIGGSLNVDSNAEINRVTNEGLLQAGGIADQSAADLKAADERTRSGLISMAQSGIDTGTASTMALKGLEVNSANAASQRAGASVGNLFNNIGQAYYQNQVNQGFNNGMYGAGSQGVGVSSPMTRYSGK